MELNKYLIITPRFNGNSTYLRGAEVKLVSQLKGNKMASNAVAIKLCLDIPEELFRKPQLQATIKFDKNQVSAPVIEAEVLENIKAEMIKQTGLDISIHMIEQ